MKNLETDAFSLLIFCATTEEDKKNLASLQNSIIDGPLGVWGKRLAKNPHVVYAVRNTQLQYLSQDKLFSFNLDPLNFWNDGNELEWECVGIGSNFHFHFDFKILIKRKSIGLSSRSLRPKDVNGSKSGNLCLNNIILMSILSISKFAFSIIAIFQPEMS
jgi:hypothetical protein